MSRRTIVKALILPEEPSAELLKALVVINEDEDDEPVEMFPTTRELKEMSSQVEAN